MICARFSLNGAPIPARKRRRYLGEVARLKTLAGFSQLKRLDEFVGLSTDLNEKELGAFA